MNRRRGYILLEISISMLIISIILVILYNLLFFSINTYKKIYSSIEIQQQGLEIQNLLERELSSYKYICKIKRINGEVLNKNEFELENVKSIYYKLENKDLPDELYLNKTTKKLFLKRNGYSSGYEIGDYVDNMYISKEKDGNIINIKLELSKNNQKHCVEFSIYNDNKGEVL